MQSLNGFTPSMLWDAVIVLVGLCAVIATVYKVIEIYRNEQDRKRRQIKEHAGMEGLVDDITNQVVRDLEPRFTSIDRELDKIHDKLDADKARLDNHERAIDNVTSAQKEISEGFSVMCMALIAVLNHEIHNGNGDEMQRALDSLNGYLTKKAGAGK